MFVAPAADVALDPVARWRLLLRNLPTPSPIFLWGLGRPLSESDTRCSVSALPNPEVVPYGEQEQEYQHRGKECLTYPGERD